MTALRLLILLLLAPPLAAQSLLVVGGGRDVPAATAWFVDQAAGPILVLDYEVDPDPGSVDDLQAAGATVTYRPVTSRAEADDPALAAEVRASGGVFLPGGNQARYVDHWQGTALQGAIQDLYASGGAVGGTSAGAMVLGEVVFDARGGSFGSREALRDPAGAPISLTTGFLSLLDGVLVDTHFYERGRIGRLLAMVARHHAESGQWITGLGLDDATAITVGHDGIAEVHGRGTVTVVSPEASAITTV
ncbi:MAG: cyanophycinase, partial [Bacteroidota bacterium]